MRAGRGNGVAVLAHPFEMKFDGFADKLFNFFKSLTRCAESRIGTSRGRVRGVARPSRTTVTSLLGPVTVPASPRTGSGGTSST